MDTITPSFSGPALPTQYTDIGNEGFGDQTPTTSYVDFEQEWQNSMPSKSWTDHLLEEMNKEDHHK